MDNNNDSSYSHILKYTGLFGGVEGLGVVVGIVRNKLVALLLGPDGMGLVSLFNSTIKLVSDSTNCGLSMSAVKNVSEAYAADDDARIGHAISVIRSWSLFTALLGFLLCIVLSPLLDKLTFSWGNHTLHFILLSPVVALMAITSGELAILKGTRHLRRLAKISIYNMVLALAISIPIYYFFGQAGIVPSLIAVAMEQMIVTTAYSFSLFKPSFSLSGKLLSEGSSMVRLGMAFVIAGILGSGVEFIIRSFLNHSGDLSAVGLYNAGYMMTMTYAGMVFSAMETDYFPRLSGIKDLGSEFNLTVNHQTEVSLLIVSPMLVAFLVSLPVLLPLLFSSEFMPVIGMMRIAILAMYCRAISLPVEYITLARGDSRSYLLLNAIYYILVCPLVIIGYQLYGITGTGLALLITGIIEVAVALIYTRRRYDFSLSSGVVRYCMAQIPIAAAAYLTAIYLSGIAYWLAGLALVIISSAVSLGILRSKTQLWNAFCNKIRNKCKRK